VPEPTPILLVNQPAADPDPLRAKHAVTMDEPTTPATKEEAVALLADFIESEELEQLEAFSGWFNVFEALGVVRSELRHSNFLAWLLDPSGSHGLGPAFLSLFLRHVSRKAREDGVEGDGLPTPFDVDAWDLSGAEVRREWRNIDLLVLDPENGAVCVIENKVFSAEHSDQLRKYRRQVATAFRDYEHRLFVFLSPGGLDPSDPHYVALAYDDVSRLLDRLIGGRGASVGGEVLTFVKHYKEMIDRRLSSDPEIERICRQIYKAHRHALDLIFAHRPDVYGETHEQLKDLITADPDLDLDHSNKTYTRFMPKALDPYVPRDEPGHFNEGRVVVFEFENRPERPLHLKLEMTPGHDELRRPILDYAQAHPALFNSATQRSGKKWKKLWGVDLDPEARTTDADERVEVLREVIADFKRTWLPQFIEAFREIGLRRDGPQPSPGTTGATPPPQDAA